jgi:hypothetical protein
MLRFNAGVKLDIVEFLKEMPQGHTENRGPDVGMDDPMQTGV